MSDDEELVDSPAQSRDGEPSNLVLMNGKGTRPIDDHPEAEEDQLEFEIEAPEKRPNFGDLIPKKAPDGRPMPVRQQIKSKGKTLVANETRPDVATPVDRVTEQVIEEVKFTYKRNEDLEIEAVTVTYVYGTRGVWTATSEAARVALGLA